MLAPLCSCCYCSCFLLASCSCFLYLLKCYFFARRNLLSTYAKATTNKTVRFIAFWSNECLVDIRQSNNGNCSLPCNISSCSSHHELVLLSFPYGSRRNTRGKDCNCIFCNHTHYATATVSTTSSVPFIAYDKVIHAVKSKLCLSRGIRAASSWAFWCWAIMLRAKSCDRTTEGQQAITICAVGFTAEYPRVLDAYVN